MGTPITLSSANRLYDIANTLLILSLVVGVLSTCIIVWMGKIKEDYSNKEIAATNERTAKAEARAAESMLELEKLRKETEPRKVTQEKQNLLQEKISGYKNHIVSFYVNPSTNENEWLMRHLAAPFSSSGWKVQMRSGDDANSHFVPDGILVMSTPHEKSIKAAKVVTKALNDVGFYATTAPLLDIQNNQNNNQDDPQGYRILILIGDKPIHKPHVKG